MFQDIVKPINSGGVTPEWLEIPLVSGSITYKIVNGFYRVSGTSSAAAASTGYIIDGIWTDLFTHPTYSTANYNTTTNELTITVDVSIYGNDQKLFVYKIGD